VDGREQGGSYLVKPKDHALRFTKFAAVFPSYEKASTSIRARVAFATSMNDVAGLQIVGHSYCGAAKLCIKYPTAEGLGYHNGADIVNTIREAGIPLEKLVPDLLKICDGDETAAANLLSRHLVLQSALNIMTYPGISEAVQAAQLEIYPLYHYIKEGTGHKSHLEFFDVRDGNWKIVTAKELNKFHYDPSDSQKFQQGLNTFFDDADISLRDGQALSIPKHLLKFLFHTTRQERAAAITGLALNPNS
jgi:carbonic anhydrase